MRNVLQVRTPENVILDFELAGIGSRGVAVVIDLLIQYTLLTMIAVIMFFIAGAEALNVMLVGDNTAYIVISLLLIFVIQFGYFLLFEYFMNGVTPGKKAVGLKVMMANGEPVSLTASFIRNFIRLADMLPGFYGIAILSVFFTKQYMRIGDLAANTVVVKLKKETKRFENPVQGKTATATATANLPISPKEEALLLEYYARKTQAKNPLASYTLDAQLYHYFYRKTGSIPNLPDQFTHRQYLDKLIEYVGVLSKR